MVKSVLFHIAGPFAIHSFGLVVCINFLLFCWLVRRRSAYAKIISPHSLNSLLNMSIVVAILGGRLLYCLKNYHTFNTVGELFFIWNGGFSFLGSLILLLIFLPCYLIVHHIPFFPFLDLVSLYAPLFQALSRIGCFFGGCCYGQATNSYPYIIYTDMQGFAPINCKLHPIQLYSAILLLLIFLFIRYVVYYKYNKEGQICMVYLVLASAERITTDFLRGDREFINNTLTNRWYLSIHQILALFLLIGALLSLLYVPLPSKKHDSIQSH